MWKRILALVVAMLVAGAASALAGAEGAAGDAAMPSTLTAGSSSLILNGIGTRTVIGIRIYRAGLYLKAKSSDAQSILNADEPMAVRLELVSGLVTPAKMEKGTREGFKKSTGGETSALEPQIEQFVALFQRGLEKGDAYDMIYIPGHGVRVLKNGSMQASIGDLAFKKALFGMWLGERTVQKRLSDGMLGL